MAATAGLVGDFTNKSGRVTRVTRMYAGGVPLEIIASNTGHKNLNSIERYNRVNCLKTRVAQAFARPENQGSSFQDHLNLELSTWRDANVGTSQSSLALNGDSVAANDLEAIVGNLGYSNFATHKGALAPARICPPNRNPSRPSFTTKDDGCNARPMLLGSNFHSAHETERIPAVLVEEEMRFLSEYYEFFGNDDFGEIHAPTHVPEAPTRIRFAMQRSLALFRRENSRLRDQLCEAQRNMHGGSHAPSAQEPQPQVASANFHHPQVALVHTPTFPSTQLFQILKYFQVSSNLNSSFSKVVSSYILKCHVFSSATFFIWNVQP
jgi:hypothetical protein